MKLGIDLTRIDGKNTGGADAVAVNLIRGLVLCGHSKDIICYCRAKIVPILSGIDPSLSVRVLPDFTSRSGLVRFIKRGRNLNALRKLAPASGADVLLFTSKYTPARRFPLKTAMITHDIQCFALPHGKLPLIAKLRRRKEQLQVWNDFRSRDLIIAISDFDVKMCRDALPRYAGKVRRIYNPVFNPLSPVSFCRNPGGKYITALNIRWSHKNTLTLIRAFERIQGEVPLDLILVGSPPPDYPKLISYIREHGMESRVTFTGFVSEKRLEEIVSETRIYVNPSLFEGFGMTAVEMISNGIPTIVAGCTASPETTRGYALTYSPPEDDAALAEVLLYEWNHPVPFEKRALASEELKSIYDCRTIAAEYWRILSEL